MAFPSCISADLIWSILIGAGREPSHHDGDLETAVDNWIKNMFKLTLDSVLF